MGKTDYPLIFVLAFLQTSFLPLNFILLLLLFLALKKGTSYLIPRLLFSSFLLGLLTASYIGLFVASLALISLGFLVLKRLLPAANFVRFTLLLLSLPAYEVLYRQLLVIFNRT